MKLRRIELFFCVLALAASARTASAEPSGDLGGVEEAYREVDFEAVKQRSAAAIRAGGHTPAEMARLEFLLGVSSAALGSTEDARAAFIRLLGMDPTQKLDRELSPRLRAPYLEARGFWSSNRERLLVTARLESNTLSLALSDPAKMVNRVQVRLRSAGQGEFLDSVRVARPTLRITLPENAKDHDVELAVALLDQFGNTVAEQGTQAEPMIVRPPGNATAPSASQTAASGLSRRPNYLLPATLSGLGVASTAAAVYFHTQRERGAKKWNSAACEHPGRTRAEQCADVERRIDQDQWLAVGLYAGGGALLTLGVLTFLGNRGLEREPASVSVACDAVASPGLGGVQCAGRF
jgi:hypothetical protein